jgi:hypothetical protein
MALRQVGNSNVYVLEVDSANLNKTNYATLVSDLRWKLWQEVKDEQARLQKLDFAIYENKVKDVEARRKALQSSKDKLAKGLKDAQSGDISIKDLIKLTSLDTNMEALGARLEYSERGRNARAQAANDLKMALATADQKTYVDVTNPITGQIVVDSNNNPVSKLIEKKGKTITITGPKLNTDGTVMMSPEEKDAAGNITKPSAVIMDRKSISIKDAQDMVDATKAEETTKGPYVRKPSARLDEAAKAFGFKDLADFMGSASGKSGETVGVIQDELSKLDSEIAKLQFPEYTGRTGSTQELRKAYSEQMGFGGLYGMEPRSNRAKPFFDETDVLPNIERKISEKVGPWIEAENKWRRDNKIPELTPGEIEAARLEFGAKLGRKLGRIESPYDNLPITSPVAKGDFLKDRKGSVTGEVKPEERPPEPKPDERPPVVPPTPPVPPVPPVVPPTPPVPPVVPPTPAGGAQTSPQVKIPTPVFSRPGLLGAEVPPAAPIPDVSQRPPSSRIGSEVDFYRSMFDTPAPVPYAAPIAPPPMLGGATPSSQVIGEKPTGILPNISETFVPPSSGGKGSPSIPYEQTPFSTTEQKMQMDAIKNKAKDVSAPKGISAATQQDRRAMYASNVVKKGIDLTEKPKKLERLAKLDLPEKERRKKVSEHILVADSLFEANSGKDNAFKAAFDELSRVYKDEKDKREEAQSYLVAKSILEGAIKKPV